MIEIIKKSFLLDMSCRVNLFLYYFKRIPLIGKLFSDRVYQECSLKTAMAILVFLISIVVNIFKKALYVGLLLFLPAFSLPKGEMRLGGYLYLFFLLSFLAGSFLNCDVLGPNQKSVTAVRFMRIPAVRYMPAQILYGNIVPVLCFLPALVLFTLLAGGSLFSVLFLFVGLLASRFLGTAFQLMLAKRFQFVLSKRPLLTLLLYVPFLTLSYVPFLIQETGSPMAFSYGQWVIHPVFVLILIGSGIFCCQYILGYGNYDKIFYLINSTEDLLTNQKQKTREAAFRDVKLKDADYNISIRYQDQYMGKKGYELLNAIFFQRHRRMILKPMYLFLIGTTFCFLTLGLLFFIFPDLSHFYYPALTSGYPVFVFIMYLLSSYLSQKATKAMFYNCDISLLRYAYYRDEKVILHNFKIRLKKITLISFIPAAAISMAILLLGILTEPARMPELLPIALLVAVLSIFFSIHNLCMYYVFQPFTTELDVKNPFYKVINFIIYFLCYLCLQIKSAPSVFVYAILGATILYSILALVLVFKFAPKNFRVK